MSEWKETTLFEIIDLIGGGTPKTKVAEYWNGNIPWLSVVDFNTGNKFVFDTEKKITRLGLENSSAKLLEKGDIIISARGTVGVVGMLGKQMAFNQSCYGVRSNRKSTNEFIYYLLKDTVSNFLQYSHGGVFDTIIRDTFKEIEILLPSLPEQKSIAEVLSSLDDKIDLLYRQNQTLQQMAETLFRQWFVEEDSDLITLGECIKTTSGGTPSRKKMEFYENGIYQWVKSKELNRGYLLDTEEKITEKALKNSSAKLLPENSILIAMYGATVGQYAILGQEATCNQAICGCIPNKDFPYTFIYYTIKANEEELKSRAVGSAQQNISQVLIKSLEISVNENIEKFHHEVDPMMKQIKANYYQIQNLKKLRDTLLPKLMSGEVQIIN